MFDIFADVFIVALLLLSLNFLSTVYMEIGRPTGSRLF